MASDSPSQGSSRRHFHRGRRGNERRSGDRRVPSPSPQQQAAPESRADHLDVEQIMREIRAKIAQRHGVELTDQQVQDLASRRLESILDPRTIKPSLLDQLRKSAGARPDTVAAADRAAVPYEFEDTTLYDSPSGFTRFMRKLLNPILKLFFNPNPLIRALHIQARLNVEAGRREAERDERQAEWNALHYELLQRIVTETARVSLEVQSLVLKVESLSAKVDFNERRVRGIEGTVHQARPAGREREREREREPREVPQPRPPVPLPMPDVAAAPPETPAAEAPASGEAPRRKRRRRRGRRGGAVVEHGAMAADTPAMAIDAASIDAAGIDGADIADAADVLEADEDEGETDVQVEIAEVVTTEGEAVAAPANSVGLEMSEPEFDVEPAPERVTPQLVTPDPEVRQEAAPELPTPSTSSEPEGHEAHEPRHEDDKPL